MHNLRIFYKERWYNREAFQHTLFLCQEILFPVHQQMCIRDRVAGEFTFSTDAKEYDVGKHEISGVFTPQDNNYQSVTDTVVVDIVSVKPEQAAPSVVRNHGIYGDRLIQIRFLDGKYKNPKTGEIIKGSFEWKDCLLYTSNAL